MENSTKKYWKSIDEYKNADVFVEEASKEFAEELPLEELANPANLELQSNRRDFLKVFGFSLSAATLAACTKAPVRKAIPLLNQPESLSPSIPNFYASTYFDGHDFASVVVKTREGRPIKIDANPLSVTNKAGINARVNASVLNLYDVARFRKPMSAGAETTWEKQDAAVIAKLNEISAAGGAIRILTHSIVSPTTQSLIASFKAKYPTTEHVVYDSISYDGILTANEKSIGKRAIPVYHFDKAQVIVGIGADFLGNWVMSDKFTTDYSTTRKVDKANPKMSRHIQFEANLSLTGSNADVRATYKPSQEGQVVARLYNEVAALTGNAGLSVNGEEVPGNLLKATARELANAKGASIVVCGSNDANIQLLVNGINSMLSNYGTTISTSQTINIKQGSDVAFAKFVDELNAGTVKALLAYGVNPVYDFANGAAIGKAIEKVDLSVSLTDRPDETNASFKHIASSHHYLESWDDAEAISGAYSLAQPAIAPLFDTRQWQESLMVYAGVAGTYYDLIQSNWKQNILPGTSGYSMFDASWRIALHDGVANANSTNAGISFNGGSVAEAAQKITPKKSGLELFLYEKIGLGNGLMANNPWLQEFPDPISRVCWDNYLIVSKSYADTNSIKEGDVVEVSANGYAVEVPVLIQPGLMPESVGLALGYGRTVAGKVGNNLGKNAFPFVTMVDGSRSYMVSNVSIKSTGRRQDLAQTQTHHTIEGRQNDILKETTLAEYIANPAAGNVRPYVAVKGEDGKFKKVKPGVDKDAITLWTKRDYKGHHWGMAIDLNACTGCGACVVSCQVENNVPVVGKDEVIRRREMHWIRIDRYYSFSDNAGNIVNQEAKYDTIEDYTNVDVSFQPLMCMQCDNAPCETVCPVLATLHNDEGLNQMVYNRCVGTRYCANNCPYKVRRFNWFNYFHNSKFDNVNPAHNDLGKMVLNPDVTVRSRGVMEKCTFCVQRIQAGKLEGKKNGSRPVDGSIKTACQQTCSAGAIVFGDLNDPNSEIAKLFGNERTYGVIEQINTQPTVQYLTKIRNRNNSNSPKA